MIELKNPSSKELDEYSFIKANLIHQLQAGNSISLWRLPNSKQKHLIVCTVGIKLLSQISIEDTEAGFIIAPFNPEGSKYFMKANLTYVFEGGRLLNNERNLPTETAMEEEFSNTASSGTSIPFHQAPFGSNADMEKKDYMDLVNKALEWINDSSIEKVVPARSKTIKLKSALDLLETFDQLCALYPAAFVSLVSSKETGTWLGASPELMVKVDEHNFSTVALAGTQLVPEDTDLKSIAWTQKEIEEQALVSRYIINCFKKIRLREFDEHGPKTWRAGNLLHLKTDFSVDMNETNFPQLGSVMLKLLHPTSAVCGMPREISLDFLAAHEGLDRSFFSGFLGPANYMGESNLYVNLRCLHWNRDKVKLYAGAGVTSDSNPEKEWEETEMKMNTLLRIIDK